MMFTDNQDDDNDGAASAAWWYQGEPAPEISWYKPRLARIEDIWVKDVSPPSVSSDATDQGWALATAASPTALAPAALAPHEVKLTQRGFVNGPFFRVAGRGKAEKCRSEEAMAVFLDGNSRRDHAVNRHVLLGSPLAPPCVSLPLPCPLLHPVVGHFLPFLTSHLAIAVVADRHEQVDLDNAPLGALIVWMDGLTDVDYLINDYAFMRATVAGNTIKVRPLVSPP